MTTDPKDKSDTIESLPQARIRTAEEVVAKRLSTRIWWLTAACALLAVGLVATSLRQRGQTIEIHFKDGHGLRAGETLRYRGIEVGEVSDVFLAEDLKGVQVRIALKPGNEAIAVEGSQFWIQRARLRLGQVAGLDTVLGAKYVGVLPGEVGGAVQRQFEGLETPLSLMDSDSVEITVSFPAGEGLDVGDPVRYRGIVAGEVTFVELQEDLESVLVGIRLVGAARTLAREGTQFWVERPKLDLTEVRGLDTLLGGRYIAILPTQASSSPQMHFVGLAEAPPLQRGEGSLEIELDAPRRLGLVRGAPITYRGLEVGRVANVALARDGASVKVTGLIEAKYAELVRQNSKWWAVGGIEVDASLRGVAISMESLTAWVRGGIAFATPESPGERVVTGYRFMLEPKPQPEWLDWKPRIAVDDRLSASGKPLPMAVRAVASWHSSWLGLYRRRTNETWGILMDDGTLRVPTSFLPESEKAKDITIEIAGQAFPFDEQQLVVLGSVAAIWVGNDLNAEYWPAGQPIADRAVSKDSVLLIVNPELGEPMAVDATRFSVQSDQSIKLAAGIAIAPELLGSPVVDANTGQLHGILVQVNEAWSIAPAR